MSGGHCAYSKWSGVFVHLIAEGIRVFLKEINKAHHLETCLASGRVKLWFQSLLFESARFGVKDVQPHTRIGAGG